MGNELLCQCNTNNDSNNRSSRYSSDTIHQLTKVYNGTLLQILQGNPLDLQLQTLVFCSFEPGDSLLVRQDKTIKSQQRASLRSMKVTDVKQVQIRKVNMLHCKLPMYQDVSDLQKVYQSYLNCLEYANKNQIEDLIFTEQNGSNFVIPKQYNAETLLRCILSYISQQKQHKIKSISFISNDYITVNTFKNELENLFTELNVPGLTEKNNLNFMKFINNELEEKVSTGIATSQDQQSLDKEPIILD